MAGGHWHLDVAYYLGETAGAFTIISYPAEAAARGEQGTLLLKIIVDRSGELIDVDLLQSSGSDQLDYEAIQAVYRAAPFGPITSHYPHQQLNIMAYFSYQLGNKYIYGQR